MTEVGYKQSAATELENGQNKSREWLEGVSNPATTDYKSSAP